jgi:hypothetical protein
MPENEAGPIPRGALREGNRLALPFGHRRGL